MTGFPAPEFDRQLQHLQKTVDRERLARADAESMASRSQRELQICRREVQLMESMAAAANRADSFREIILFALEQLCTHLNWPVGQCLADRRGRAAHLVLQHALAPGSRLRRRRNLPERVPTAALPAGRRFARHGTRLASQRLDRGNSRR